MSDATTTGYTGTPTRTSRLNVALLQAAKSASKLFGVRSFSATFGSALVAERPPAFATRGLQVTRTISDDGWPIYTLEPRNPTGKCVVAIHGGSYILQPTVLHWFDYAQIARATGATVIAPLYPLAPDATARTVVPQMSDFIAKQIAEHGTGQVSVYGDSAGGGIALSAVQQLVGRRNDGEGELLPSHLVLVSPTLELTFTDPALSLVNDPVLDAVSLRADGEAWAGIGRPDALELTDPLVSPLYGSLTGLPPIALYSGSLEVLAPSALALQQKALATPGADFTFVLRKGQIHNWAMGVTSGTRNPSSVRRDIYRQLGLAADP